MVLQATAGACRRARLLVGGGGQGGGVGCPWGVEHACANACSVLCWVPDAPTSRHLCCMLYSEMTTEHPGPPVLPQPSTPPPHPPPPTSPHPLAFPAGIVVSLVAAGAGLVLAGRLLFRRCRARQAGPGSNGAKGQPIASITAEDVAAVWGKEGSEASTDANEVLVAQLLSEAPSPQVWCPGGHAADLGA